MKTAIAITLIIVGGMLIVSPILSDYEMHEEAIKALRIIPPKTDFTLHPDGIGSWYRFGCWLVGAAMITAGIVSSRREA
jgi:hypothetical protein